MAMGTVDTFHQGSQVLGDCAGMSLKASKVALKHPGQRLLGLLMKFTIATLLAALAIAGVQASPMKTFDLNPSLREVCWNACFSEEDLDCPVGMHPGKTGQCYRCCFDQRLAHDADGSNIKGLHITFE
ncbi:hypothetical protein H0H93_009487 [Arthromyces matolae]|nr:hypothetical protein H0H93_009487 [Arthromyces matolae]